MSAYNPYQVLSDNLHWTMAFVRLPDGECGRWYEHLKTMLIDDRLGRVVRRCTVAHEVEHALAGDVGCGSAALEARQESRCEQRAAHKLIPLARLAEVAAAHPDDPHRVADELDVDYDTLAVRLRHLHPSERHYLRRRLAHTEESA